MAHRGLILDEGDEQIEFLASAADTNGEMVRCRVTVASRRPAPPEHSHPVQQETFKVESGRLGYVLGDTEHEAGPGEIAVVPPGTNHTFWAAGKEPLVVTIDVKPALRFEDWAETIHVLIRDGKLKAGGRRPNPLLIAVVADTFRNEWRLTQLSPVARTLIPVLAFIGRRAGLHGHYRADGKPASRPAAASI